MAPWQDSNLRSTITQSTTARKSGALDVEAATLMAVTSDVYEVSDACLEVTVSGRSRVMGTGLRALDPSGKENSHGLKREAMS